MYRFILLAFLFLLFSCEKKNTKENTAPDSLSVIQKDSTVQTEKEVQEVPQNAPEWYTDIPEKEGYLYVTANARSKRADIAEDKAEHLARVLMARKIENLERESQKTNSGAQAEKETDVETQNLSYSIVVKKKRIKEGDYWRAFVLLEMKTTEK
jgi:hypothetical protein